LKSLLLEKSEKLEKRRMELANIKKGKRKIKKKGK